VRSIHLGFERRGVSYGALARFRILTDQRGSPRTDEHVAHLAGRSVSLPALRAGETLEGRVKT